MNCNQEILNKIKLYNFILHSYISKLKINSLFCLIQPLASCIESEIPLSFNDLKKKIRNIGYNFSIFRHKKVFKLSNNKFIFQQLIDFQHFDIIDLVIDLLNDRRIEENDIHFKYKAKYNNLDQLEYGELYSGFFNKLNWYLFSTYLVHF